MISLPALVAERATRTPDLVAARTKKLGIWQQTSWAQLDREFRLIAHGLADLGIGAGDRIAVLAGNRAEWMHAELAGAALGAIFVGVHPAAPTRTVEQTLTDAAVRVLIAEDQEQIDKALAAGSPRLRWIVHLESHGLESYSDSRLLPYESLRERGRTHRAEHPNLLESMTEERSDPVVTLVYPGDSSAPIELRGSDIERAVATVARAVPGRPPSERDVVLPGLSLCEPAERALTVWTSIGCGAVVHFAESYDTLTEDLTEVQPTLRLAPAAAWQRICQDVEQRMARAARVKRICYHLAQRAADRAAAQQLARGGRHTPISLGLYAIGQLLTGRALRDKLGLRATRAAFWAIDVPGTALPIDAPPGPEAARFFLGLGVPIGCARQAPTTQPAVVPDLDATP